MFERFSQPAVAGFCSPFVGSADYATVLFADDASEHRWGMLTGWRDREGGRPPPIRLAGLETLAITPVLRKATRCLVPAASVMTKTMHDGRSHRWQLVAGIDHMLLAAISSTNEDDEVPSFAIVTVPAPSAVDAYTPVVPALADERWLDDGEVIEHAWRTLAWGSIDLHELY